MKNIIKNTLGILVLVIIITAVAYIGSCAYANLVTFQKDGTFNTPKVSSASHSFRIMNTGNTLMASDYEQQGSITGQRIFTLHGYWELVKDDYKYRKGDITLDERVFGEIRATKR